MAGEVLDPIVASDLIFVPETGRAIYRGRQIKLQPLLLKVLQFIHRRHPDYVSNLDLRKGVWKSENRDPNLVQRAVSTLNNTQLSGFGFFVECNTNIGYRIVEGERHSAVHNRHAAQNRLLEKSSSIQAFKDWGAANPIISRAQNSLVIIDSYFGHSGEIEPLIKEALSNTTNRIDISIYLASPLKDFGAQRFKEKETPKGLHLTYKQLLVGDKKRDEELMEHFRNEYTKTYDSSVNEIKAHFIKPGRIRLRIYIYPIMPATRVYVVDNIHYIFGCFPLLAHNPGHPCFYATMDQNLSDAGMAAINALAQQVKIIRRISNQVWP